MATPTRARVSHDSVSTTQERFQRLDKTSSDQIAMIEEAMTMANAILKLAAMDGSFTRYISAAENSPYLVQRLLLGQNAANKEAEFAEEVQEGSVEEVSVEEVASRLKRSTKDGPRVVEKPQRKKRASSTSTSRTSTRSSVSTDSQQYDDLDSRKQSRESVAGKTENRRSVEGAVDILLRTSTPGQMAPSRPRTKSPQISELPRLGELGEDLDRRSSRARSVAEKEHFNLRCWGAVFTGLAGHWVRRSPRLVRAQ